MKSNYDLADHSLVKINNNHSEDCLKAVLYRNARRYTPEREAVYRIVLNEQGEFNAGDICCALNDEISCVTVYSTLDLFCRIGIIEKVPTCENYIMYKVK